MGDEKIGMAAVWVPLAMIAIVGIELGVVALLWTFPIHTWRDAGEHGGALLAALGMTFYGIAGLFNPQTSYTHTVTQHERVRIDGRGHDLERDRQVTEPLGRWRAWLFVIGGPLLFVGLVVWIAAEAHHLHHG